MSEVRKLAAILVADIVGCSRLARADDEGTLGVMSPRVSKASLLPTGSASRRMPGVR